MLLGIGDEVSRPLEAIFEPVQQRQIRTHAFETTAPLAIREPQGVRRPETFFHNRGCFQFDLLKRFCKRVIARIRRVNLHSSPTGLSGPAVGSDDHCKAVGGLMTIGQLSPDRRMPQFRLLDDIRLGE
jgi:hypothetical protein